MSVTKTAEECDLAAASLISAAEIEQMRLCMIRAGNHDVVHRLPGTRRIVATLIAMQSDLARLAGPKCPYDGKYAVDHKGASAVFRCSDRWHHEFLAAEPGDKFFVRALGEGLCIHPMINGLWCGQPSATHRHGTCDKHKLWAEGEAWLWSNTW